MFSLVQNSLLNAGKLQSVESLTAKVKEQRGLHVLLPHHENYFLIINQ